MDKDEILEMWDRDEYYEVVNNKVVDLIVDDPEFELPEPWEFPENESWM